MKQAFLSVLFLIFGATIWVVILLGCKDVERLDFNPYDASQIEGLWRGDLHPHWYYHFSDGQLHQQIFDFSGSLNIEHWWGYRTSADTIYLRDMIDETDYRIFTVYFDNDNSAFLTDVTDTIHPTYKIKRFE